MDTPIHMSHIVSLYSVPEKKKKNFLIILSLQLHKSPAAVYKNKRMLHIKTFSLYSAPVTLLPLVSLRKHFYTQSHASPQFWTHALTSSVLPFNICRTPCHLLVQKCITHTVITSVHITPHPHPHICTHLHSEHEKNLHFAT